MASAWLEFLAKFRKSHPNLKGKDVMKAAAVEYKKKKPATDKAKVVKKEKKEKVEKVPKGKKGKEVVEE